MSSFIEADLFNEILIYQAPLLVGGSNAAVAEIGISTMAEAKQLDFTEVNRLGNDILIRATARKAQ